MGNSSRLADSTAKQILKMIEEEERFSVGDKLPNENDFAAELGVSRSTLREAVERKILSGEDRTVEEQKFHESIANATHNAFVKQFIPIIFNAIKKGVVVMMKDSDVSKDNMSDDRLIMDFIKKRNPDGARTAMRLHIIHAMEGLQKN